MTKRIRLSDPTAKLIRDTSVTAPLLEASEVAKALGAEASSECVTDVLAPVTLLAVRVELVKCSPSNDN